MAENFYEFYYIVHICEKSTSIEFGDVLAVHRLSPVGVMITVNLSQVSCVKNEKKTNFSTHLILFRKRKEEKTPGGGLQTESRWPHDCVAQDLSNENFQCSLVGSFVR